MWGSHSAPKWAQKGDGKPSLAESDRAAFSCLNELFIYYYLVTTKSCYFALRVYTTGLNCTNMVQSNS